MVYYNEARALCEDIQELKSMSSEQINHYCGQPAKQQRLP
jgi:hypothetical protein